MSKYQKFVTEEITRDKIMTADYNPRLIDENNKKALEKGLKEHGLVAPLVWNKRTGNLVSGHQRLSVLDKLEKSKNYELTVAVIDVDEKEEKIINVQMNNKSMQGEFDFDMLGDLSESFGIDMSDFGFNDFDVDMMFGANEKFQDLLKDTKAVEATKEEIKSIREQRKQMNEKYSEEQNADFYFVVVCKNQADKDAILSEISIPKYERYITSEQLRRIKK